MKITSKLVLGAFSAVCLLAAPGCDDKKDAKADDAKTEAKADDKKADEKADEKPEDVKADEAPADGGAAADGGEAAAADKVGVAECDEYIEKMTKCLEGMDEATAAAAKPGMDTVVKGWKDAIAANPEAKASMAAGCKAALDGAATAYPDCFKAAE